MERSDILKEYVKTLAGIIWIEGAGLINDIRELNICQELGETSCGLLNMGTKVLHYVVKHMVVNIPVAMFETTIKTYDVLTNRDTDKAEDKTEDKTD